jgi:hypothetical protein
MIENPTIGGIHRRAMTGPLTFHFIEAYALNETAKTCDNPTGTLNKMVL